eukprot:scaffold4488_cov358-Prasinococcus_capsulatus_cf.AAC.4
MCPPRAPARPPAVPPVGTSPARSRASRLAAPVLQRGRPTAHAVKHQRQDGERVRGVCRGCVQSIDWATIVTRPSVIFFSTIFWTSFNLFWLPVTCEARQGAGTSARRQGDAGSSRAHAQRSRSSPSLRYRAAPLAPLP